MLNVHHRMDCGIQAEAPDDPVALRGNGSPVVNHVDEDVALGTEPGGV